jgi:hypothetical protein
VLDFLLSQNLSSGPKHPTSSNIFQKPVADGPDGPDGPGPILQCFEIDGDCFVCLDHQPARIIPFRFSEGAVVMFFNGFGKAGQC